MRKSSMAAEPVEATLDKSFNASRAEAAVFYIPFPPFSLILHHLSGTNL